MKQILIYIKLLLFICTSLGCNLTNIFDKTKVKGKVINVITGNSMPNVKVIIKKSNFSLSQPGLVDVETVKETTTDRNGEFSFDFNAQAAPSYECVLNDPYITFYGDRNFELTKHSSNSITFQIAPAGKIDYLFKNVNCTNENDTLKFTENTLYPNCCGIDTLIVVGCNSRDVQPLDRPMGTYYLWWQVNRAGVLTDFRDTIFLEEGEERLYEVNY